ncbi:unnamed protein product, partial [Sphacelaria rigidula]
VSNAPTQIHTSVVSSDGSIKQVNANIPVLRHERPRHRRGRTGSSRICQQTLSKINEPPGHPCVIFRSKQAE